MNHSNNRHRRWLAPLLLALAVAAPPAARASGDHDHGDGDGATEAQPERAAPARGEVERQGLKVDFSATPSLGRIETERGLIQGDRARVRFRITDAETGEPVEGLYPGAWMDLSSQQGEGLMDCGERLSMYLGGTTGMRPLLDMNSYFIVVMNNDASISVIDPAVLVAGVPDNFFTQVVLKRPGGDWAKSADQKRLYVSMPRADEVAVVDTDQFEVSGYIPTGGNPLRVELQPDGRYLWVGFDGGDKGPSGVTVIDTRSDEVVAEIETGAGHHELAFSDDSRTAFVSNREEGTVSVIDIERLEKTADIEVGELALSVAHSPLSQRAYATDGERGRIAVIEPASGKVVKHVDLAPGVGPLRFDASGRWAFALNPGANEVYVIDASSDTLAHRLEIEGEPYQVSFSRNFAYLRGLATAEVQMVNLSQLARNDAPPVTAFDAGQVPPGRADRLSIADTVVSSPVEAAMVVANPADSRLYFYMEGKNFPMGTFRSYGHSPRAVEIVDRALVETEPGVYESEIKIPLAGEFDVAFVLEAPRVLHCFAMEVDQNPMLAQEAEPLAVDYLVDERRVSVAEPYELRFRLMDPNTNTPLTGLDDVRVRFFRAPNRDRTELAAEEVGDGVYQARLDLPGIGAYYVYVAVPGMQLDFMDLPYLTLRGMKPRDRQLGMADDGGSGAN